MNRILVWLAAGVVALGIAGCGGSGGGDADPPTLGASGGTVRGPDGLSVRIDPDALDSDVTIALAADASGAPPLPVGIAAVGPVYAATPHGIAFARPARLRVPLPAALAVPDARPTLLTAAPGGEWVVLSGARRDGDAMVVDVTTFSYYTVVQCSSIDACQDLVLDATVRLDLADEDPARVGPHLDRAEATFRTPRYVPVKLSFTSPGGVTNLFVYKLFITSRAGRREVAAGPMGTSPMRIEIPVLEADNGYKALEVDIFCAGVEIVPLCDRSGTGLLTAIKPFTVRLLGSQFVVDIPRGTPVTSLLPVVTEQPGDLLVPPGAASVPFTVAVAQPNIVHFWEVSRDQGATWTDLGSYPVRFGSVIVPFEGERFYRVTADPALRSTLDYARNFNVNPPSGDRRAVDASLNGLRVRARLVNAFGERLSRVATLTVASAVAPAIVQQPQSAAVAEGQGASFTVVASGTPAPALQWQSRAAGSSTWIDVAGQTRATYATGPLALAANGSQFRVRVSSTAGSVTSDAATVSVTSAPLPPAIVTPPQPLTIAAGSTALFAATVTGTGPLSYQWLRNSVAIPGANTPLLRLDAVPLEASGASFRLRVSNAVGSVDSSTAVLTVVPAEGGAPLTPPAIATQPAPVNVNAGNTATFAVGVSGSGPFTFQWRRNGTPIDGATAAAYTIATAATEDAGSYSVVVTNGAGSATSSGAALVVTAPAPSVAPTITTGPTSVVVLPQATTTLAVAATGSAPLSYEWRRNGVVVDGATASLLTLTGIGAGQAGSYTVIVSNGAGTVTSSAAQVLLVGTPLITAPPVGTAAVEGGTVKFTVTASGDLLRYQWTRNGVAIDGATAASYTTPTLALADNGAVYAVIVYNGAGLVTSSGALLTVTEAPPPPALEKTTLASVTSAGGVPDNASGLPTLSANGRRVAFVSEGTNLGAGGAVAGGAYVRDLDTGTTVQVNLTPDGSPGSRRVGDALKISGNGRYVIFSSDDPGLVAGDTNVVADVFVRDLQAGSTARVSVRSDGAQVNADGIGASADISADGRYVLFQSSADLTGTGSALPDGLRWFLRDLQLGGISGIPAFDGFNGAVLSGDGMTSAILTVVFDSYRVLVRDREGSVRTMLSIAASDGFVGGRPALSHDGRYVAFVFRSATLIGGAAATANQIGVIDTFAGNPASTLELVSRTAGGAPGDGGSDQPMLSADGRYVLFSSRAPALTDGLGQGCCAAVAVVRDRVANTTRVANRDANGAGFAPVGQAPAISSDGSTVAFGADIASVLGSGTLGGGQVFVAPRP